MDREGGWGSAEVGSSAAVVCAKGAPAPALSCAAGLCCGLMVFKAVQEKQLYCSFQTLQICEAAVCFGVGAGY